jgi:hypothetical protein
MKLNETASITVMYDGWLLEQNRVTKQTFASVMDDYDRLCANADTRKKLLAAAHYAGRKARAQDLVARAGAARTLLWWLFRSGTMEFIKIGVRIAIWSSPSPAATRQPKPISGPARNH